MVYIVGIFKSRLCGIKKKDDLRTTLLRRMEPPGPIPATQLGKMFTK